MITPLHKNSFEGLSVLRLRRAWQGYQHIVPAGPLGFVLSLLLAVAGNALLPMLVCRMILACTFHVGRSGDKFARYSTSYFANLWRSICCLNLMSQPASLWAQTTLYRAASGWVRIPRMFSCDNVPELHRASSALQNAVRKEQQLERLLKLW